MAVEEGRRIALHRAATESWGEEVANTLADLVAPAGHELATRQDINGILQLLEVMDERWQERTAAMERRFDDRMDGMERRLEDRMDAMERRFDERFVAMEVRSDDRLVAMERRSDEGVTSLDARWQAEAQGLRHELLAAFERRLTDAVNDQTRTLVVSQLVALVVIAGLAFGLQ